MDEQLEQQIEGRGAEAQIEEVLSPAGEEAAEEAAEAAAIPEGEVNTESSAEETEISDAELSASGEEDNTSPTADAVPPPHEGRVEEVPRNYYAEWQELAEAHPEVVGKELPEDIYQECMRSELPPLRVYESMMLRKQAEQISALRQEIATLRQNAENTARAPVSASAGSPENAPEDQFMQGFNSY